MNDDQVAQAAIVTGLLVLFILMVARLFINHLHREHRMHFEDMGELENLPPPNCTHPSVPRPFFDADAAFTVSAGEVRRRWPRTESPCPDCGAFVIRYASSEHAIAGDW